MKSVQLNARIAGVLYILIAILSGFVHFYIPSKLIVTGDATSTSINIMSSEVLFRMGIGAELVVLLTEIVVSIILYKLLKPVNQTLALIATVFRLAMTTIHGMNVLNNIVVLLLLNGSDYLTSFQPDQIYALVMLFINAYSYGFTIGIVFFILHVFLLGYLILKSEYFPKFIGILFIIASFGYMIDSFSHILLAPNYQMGAAYFSIPITVAEIAFPLWLLIKGVNARQWERYALESD